jgi:hypothetical protein
MPSRHIFASVFMLFCLLASTAAALTAPEQSAEKSQSAAVLRQLDTERAKQNATEKALPSAHVARSPRDLALPSDIDDDGMPDSWETDHSLNPYNPDDAWLDPDGDTVPNLFEFQLGSDPHSSATPPAVNVGVSSNVAAAINSASPGTVIRVAGGTYSVNYITFSPKVVMIQGGWSSDFSQRNLKLYPTTFDGGLKDEVLYFSVSSGESAVIVDGIRFIRAKEFFGAVNLLASGSAVMRTSMLNCTVTSSVTDFSSGGIVNLFNWDTSQADRTIVNTVISGNQGSGIYSQITGSSSARWRIVNSTISHNKKNGSNGYGIEAFTLDTAVLTSHIHNSILWGNELADIEISRNITFGINNSDLGRGNAVSGAAINQGSGMLSLDPSFVNPDTLDLRLRPSSLVINKGINQGIPAMDCDGLPRIVNGFPDMGAYEFQEGAAANIMQLGPVAAGLGKTSVLLAQVENVGSETLPSNASVWFYVEGPGWSNSWVGAASVAGLSPGAYQWYAFNWTIPAGATPGNYSLKAQVWTTIPISEFSGKIDFTVTASAIPGKATLVSPSGQIATSIPTYTWNAVSDATWYQLWVNDSVSSQKIQSWYTSEQAGCASGTGACSVTPTTALAAGQCQWWILTWNEKGYGPWSDGMSFTVVGGVAPGKATLVSPSGSISSTNPTYTWSAVSAATWYQLWVNDGVGSPKIQLWYTATQAGCASGTGTCSVTPATAVAAGQCRWWILTWNTYGYGPWSDGMSFTVSTAGVPGKASLVWPSGSIASTTPTYAWNAVPAATWYQLWVNDSIGSPKIQSWYTAAQAGCASGSGTCSVTPPTSLAPGQCQWWIQTWNTYGYGPWSDGMAFTVLGSASDGFASQFNSSADGSNLRAGPWRTMFSVQAASSRNSWSAKIRYGFWSLCVEPRILSKIFSLVLVSHGLQYSPISS